MGDMAQFMRHELVARGLPQGFHYPLFENRATGKQLRLPEFLANFVQQAIRVRLVAEAHAVSFSGDANTSATGCVAGDIG
jgi:hypothetical protein